MKEITKIKNQIDSLMYVWNKLNDDFFVYVLDTYGITTDVSYAEVRNNWLDAAKCDAVADKIVELKEIYKNLAGTNFIFKDSYEINDPINERNIRKYMKKIFDGDELSKKYFR